MEASQRSGQKMVRLAR